MLCHSTETTRDSAGYRRAQKASFESQMREYSNHAQCVDHAKHLSLMGNFAEMADQEPVLGVCSCKLKPQISGPGYLRLRFGTVYVTPSAMYFIGSMPLTGETKVRIGHGNIKLLKKQRRHRIELRTQTKQDVGVGECNKYILVMFSGSSRQEIWELLDGCLQRFVDVALARHKSMAPSRVHRSLRAPVAANSTNDCITRPNEAHSPQ